MKQPFTAIVAGFVALAAPMVGAESAAADNIGVVASIDPNLQGTPPGSTSRKLVIGAGVVSNEEIVSSSRGRGQLLFNDETTLSLAPSSRIVLDRFVYDPAKKSGNIGLTLTRGALRFIGGQTTERQSGLIRTPTATIGIRGSSAIVMYENGRTLAIFLAGDKMCVNAGAGETCTNKQGGVLSEQGYIGQIASTSMASIIERIDGEPPTELVRSAILGTDGGGVTGTSSSDDPTSTRGARRQTGLFDNQIDRDRFGSGVGSAPGAVGGLCDHPGNSNPRGNAFGHCKGNNGVGFGVGGTPPAHGGEHPGRGHAVGRTSAAVP